jgi:hypothetical protein
MKNPNYKEMLSRFSKCFNLIPNNFILWVLEDILLRIFHSGCLVLLKGLTSLELTYCIICLYLLQLGTLSFLKYLKISNTSHVNKMSPIIVKLEV